MIALKELLRRPIAFHRIFVDITGSVNAALFLSQACYWSEVTDWDWFYKTQQDWEKETGLTRHEQDHVRRKLVRLEVIHEIRRGVPAKMHYRVDAAVLADLIVAFRQSVDLKDRQTRMPESGNPYKEAEITAETTQREKKEITLPSWLPIEQWNAYVQMRHRIRKPMTGYAEKLAIKKLDELRTSGHDPGTVLEHCILNSYQGIFPPRDERNGNGQQQRKSASKDREDRNAANGREALRILQGYDSLSDADGVDAENRGHDSATIDLDADVGAVSSALDSKSVSATHEAQQLFPHSTRNYRVNRNPATRGT